VAVSAFNAEGAGPPSPSLILRTDPGGLMARKPQDSNNRLSFLGTKEGVLRDPLRQPWFIVIIAITVILILASGVLIFLMRQKSGGKKPAIQHITLSLPKNDLGSHHALSPGGSSLVRDALWVDRSWFRGEHPPPHVHQNSLHSHHHLQTHQIQQHHQGKMGTTSSSKILSTNWVPSSGYDRSSSPVDDPYSVIESNEYAEVSENQNLSTFKRQNNLLMQHQQIRSTTPGPYATTNLINITSNAMYRGHDEYEGGPYSDRGGPFMDLRRSNAPSPSPYKTRGCID